MILDGQAPTRRRSSPVQVSQAGTTAAAAPPADERSTAEAVTQQAGPVRGSAVSGKGTARLPHVDLPAGLGPTGSLSRRFCTDGVNLVQRGRDPCRRRVMPRGSFASGAPRLAWMSPGARASPLHPRPPTPQAACGWDAARRARTRLHQDGLGRALQRSGELATGFFAAFASLISLAVMVFTLFFNTEGQKRKNSMVLPESLYTFLQNMY